MRKGSKMSVEARQKISEWNKVNNRWRGKHFTPEQRAQLSETARTSEAAQRHREQLAASRRGKPRKPFADPVAHSLAMSRAGKGKKHHVTRRIRFDGPPAPVHLTFPEFPGCLPVNGDTVARVASVYALVNSVSGKLYVGSTVNTERRWFIHRIELAAGRHYNRHLQYAWRKYGAAAFAFRLLEVVTDFSTLQAREQYWIDHYQATDSHYGYNVLLEAYRPTHRGDQNGRAKLKSGDIPSIRARLAAGESRRALAREYGVSKSAIHSLAEGKSWGFIP